MKIFMIICFGIILSACNNEKSVKKKTLSDFVVNDEQIVRNKAIIVNKEKAKNAYQAYLSSSSSKSSIRKNALQRLAEIQLDMTVSNPEKYVGKSDKSSISLFKKRLREFPNDSKNDVVLYQLANAYAVSGRDDKKVDVLEQLVDKYPESKFYIESMFRLGESYLTKSQFIDAELALTSVIVEDRSSKYKNNALFKRAWSKYKQLRYSEAIEDYNHLLAQYSKGSSSNRSDQEFLNNIYKVYGACISYLGIDSTLDELSSHIPNNDIRFHIYKNLAKSLSNQGRNIDAAMVYDKYLHIEKSNQRNDILTSLSELWVNYKTKEYSIEKLLALESMYGISSNSFKLNQAAKQRLSNNLVYISEFYHSLYQKTKERKKRTIFLAKARASYTDLIKKYIRKDMVRYKYQYAELMQESGHLEESLDAYKSVFVDKSAKKYRNKSAYAMLTLANKMYLTKKITKSRYTKLNSQYLNNLSQKHVYKLLLSFSEHLYNNKQFEQAVSHIEEQRHLLDNKNSDKLKFILASSYFEIGEFAESEKTFRVINNKNNIYTDLNKRLALSIFKQAELLKDKYLYEASIKKYDQISADKLDDNVNLLAQIDVSSIHMQTSEWKKAIQRLNKIRLAYPNSKFNHQIINQLSVAYLNNNQDKLSAIEFEKIAGFTKDVKLKQSALWQAAELYETGNDIWSSVRTYKQYVNKFPSPVSLNFEAQYKLSQLYTKLKLFDKRNYWLSQLIKNSAKKNLKTTERIQYLASNATITLARDEYVKYSRVKLKIPLKVSLRKKKKVLKTAISSLQKVNKYKMYEHISESIYWIAETYYDFSKSLLKSERPKNLSELELEQYDVLIEDQAIPFEDQAIRYFLQNIKSTGQGKYSNWVGRSFEKLSQIYPSKYKRRELVETHVGQFY